jgi:MOSC domain-containing protein YiiM
VLIGKIVSVNVGVPREVLWSKKLVKISIFKNPVNDRVEVGRLGLEGDRQADLTVHGGRKKALYAYPAEHYEYWKHLLENPNLGWGMFGENLTTQDVLENQVHVGGHLRIGSAEGVVSSPGFHAISSE